jgi:hypothetical protein
VEKVKGSEYFPNALYGKGVVSFLFEVQKQYIIYMYIHVQKVHTCTYIMSSSYTHLLPFYHFAHVALGGGKEGENAQLSFIPANCTKSAPQFEGQSDYNEDLREGFPGHR